MGDKFTTIKDTISMWNYTLKYLTKIEMIFYFIHLNCKHLYIPVLYRDRTLSGSSSNRDCLFIHKS